MFTFPELMVYICVRFQYESLKQSINNLLAELKNRLKISIFLWRKSCASR